MGVFCEKVRDRSIGFQKGFLDEGKQLLRRLVLNNSDLAIYRVAIFTQGFVLALDAGQNAPAVCYPHTNIISNSPAYSSKNITPNNPQSDEYQCDRKE